MDDFDATVLRPAWDEIDELKAENVSLRTELDEVSRMYVEAMARIGRLETANTRATTKNDRLLALRERITHDNHVLLEQRARLRPVVAAATTLVQTVFDLGSAVASRSPAHPVEEYVEWRNDDFEKLVQAVEAFKTEDEDEDDPYV